MDNTKVDEVYAYLKNELGIEGTLNDLLYAYYKRQTGLEQASFADAQRGYFEQTYGREGTVNDVKFSNLGAGVRKNLFDRSKVNNLALGPTIVEQVAYRGYTLPVTPGDTYIISRTDTRNNRFRYVYTSVEPAHGGSYFGGTGNTPTYDNSLTTEVFGVPAGATHLFLYLSNQADDIPGILIEKTAVNNGYFDGDSLGAVWDGEPHASTSTYLGPGRYLI